MSGHCNNDYVHCGKRRDINGRYGECTACESNFNNCDYKGKFPYSKDDGSVRRLCTMPDFLPIFVRERGIK